MSTPHIQANCGEIAPRILLPGDPLRAKYIAETFFDSPVCFNRTRGVYGYTGTYKGVPVSAMGTGMGIPSISIYASELVKFYGVKTLIRVGTCGSFREEIGLKDIILAQGCCTDSGILRHKFDGDYAPLADFELLNTAYETALERGKKVYVGLVKSTDLLYQKDKPYGFENWIKYGAIGAEMEGAALYTIAARYNARALCVCSVSDGKFQKEVLSQEEKERSLKDMLELALEAAIRY